MGQAAACAILYEASIPVRSGRSMFKTTPKEAHQLRISISHRRQMHVLCC